MIGRVLDLYEIASTFCHFNFETNTCKKTRLSVSKYFLCILVFYSIHYFILSNLFMCVVVRCEYFMVDQCHIVHYVCNGMETV